MDGASKQRIWCEVCDTDEYILIEHAHKRRHHKASTWDVEYSCTECETFYAHDIFSETLTTPMAYAIIAIVQRSGQGDVFDH
ncbi:hypothetical protein ART_1310 [Arthrobacter sp. PAMC 25486]|uniref:hypothetical protein n=1 Tax=Arthrobacter sp. PAMC 25486 TaxID=1494608 RepID=UPI000535D8E8|nr:hypothetical protein [Arthrobacter sp. PAMC 25486]AIY00909.1 hypothetical protein ART_1310 [Arthrobacter sp. PAMC 25486]